MKREGQIKVHSENIFPIIKKWLYSDKDIFLRELVSNGSDAIKKLERLQGIGEAEIGEFSPRIDVCVDKENRTITISDNGKTEEHTSELQSHQLSRMPSSA